MTAQQMEPGGVPAFGLRHRLALALEVAELKPEDMADEIGRGPTTIRNYLSGRTLPSRAVITAWAFRCSVDRDWIEHGEARSGQTGPDTPGGLEITPRAWNADVIDLRTRTFAPSAIAA